jgi:hypothetical protein
MIKPIHTIMQVVLLPALALLASCDRSQPQQPAVQATKDAPFAVGQVWAYHARSGEESSRLIICKIETDPKFGPLVHVAVVGLKVRAPQSPTGMADTIRHMPFTEQALRGSVTDVVGLTKDLPPYQTGYSEWRAAVEKGAGGVWAMQVKDAVTYMEDQYTGRAKPTTAQSAPQDMPAEKRQYPPFGL